MIATGDRARRDRTTLRAWAWTCAGASVDLDALRARIGAIVERLEAQDRRLLESQGVEHRAGHRAAGRRPPRWWPTPTEGELTFEADAVMVSTGSRPRIPDWATARRRPDPDHPGRLPAQGAARAPGGGGLRGDGRGVRPHVLELRLPRSPSIVSRQQVLPGQGPRGRRGPGGRLPRPRRAALSRGPGPSGWTAPTTAWSCAATTAVWPGAPTCCWPSVRSPTSEGLGLAEAGVDMDGPWVREVDHHMRTNVEHIYVAGDVSGKLPLSARWRPCRAARSRST